MSVAIIGAGISGATVARVLAERGHSITLFERLDHVGGHCHTRRDAETGIMLHVHGPHIFHTDNDAVRDFAARFTRFRPFELTVTANARGRRYRLPITLTTLEEFFGTSLDEEGARRLLAAQVRRYPHPPRNLDEQGRAMVGDAIYETFFEGYTRKQWGRDPSELPASVIRRIPVRFTRDQSYYNHPFVAIPEDGYTAMMERMVDHPGITLRLGCPLEPGTPPADHGHTVYTGPLDAWFGHRHGRLPYRTLDFEMFRASGTHQDTAVHNYCDGEVPFTRITEHKHFAPWEQFPDTVCSREFSRECEPGDTPYYPVNLASGSARLSAYEADALATRGVSFVGRLATFRYLDMDVAIREALRAADDIDEALRRGVPPASLPHRLDPQVV
ncbi:MAG: FAD-dependent oxidoreductase [Thermoleophilia bacterium]